MSLDCAFSAGALPTMIVGEPGAHGATVAGIHGIGVNVCHRQVIDQLTVGWQDV